MFCIFELFVCVLLFKTSPKYKTEVLSYVSKQEKAVICHMEKIHVLDNFCSFMNL